MSEIGADLGPERWLELLAAGQIEVLGRMPWSSNATYLVEVTDDGLSGRAIYKPGRGERPLWDFPGGLFRREAAAYEISIFTELEVVPETIVRPDGPLGDGSLQRFIDADFEEHYFTLAERDDFADQLHLIAGFDLLVNNADRKGGHLLLDHAHRIWAIDNGLCFHIEEKLRTVMWDFAGEELPARVLRACERLIEQIPDQVGSLLLENEVEALVRRAKFYLEYGCFPSPGDNHRAYPWPLV